MALPAGGIAAVRPATEAEESPAALRTVRRLLLAVLLFGMIGATLELLLLGHTEEPWQFAPLTLLAIGIVTTIVLAFRTTPRGLRFFRALMLLFVAAGVMGLYLHYHGNTEFELEMYPSIRGFELFWKSITGATPALAPGTMIQFGLLGLVVAWKHPNLRRVAAQSSEEES